MRRSSVSFATAFLTGLLNGQANNTDMLDHFCPAQDIMAKKAAAAKTQPATGAFKVEKASLEKLQEVAAGDMAAAMTEVVKKQLTAPMLVKCLSHAQKMNYLADPNVLAFGSPERTENAEAALQVVKGKLSGTKRLTLTAAGVVPKFAVVFAEVTEGDAKSIGAFVVNVAAGTKGVKLSASCEASFFVDVVFDGADATKLEFPQPEEPVEAKAEEDMQSEAFGLVGKARVASATAALGAIDKLLEVATLHATAHSRAGVLLCHQQAIQGKLAFLEMHRFALESFISYVNNTPSFDGEAFNTVEAVLLHFYATTHLKNAVRVAHEIVHPFATNDWRHQDVKKDLVGEKAKPETEAKKTDATEDITTTAGQEVESMVKADKYEAINVEYSAIAKIEAQVAQFEKLHGFDAEVLAHYVVPQLKIAGDSPAGKSAGKSKTTQKLSGTHINLEPSLVSLETDIAAFPSHCHKLRKNLAKKSPTEQAVLNNTLAAYLSEMVASTAVAYRATHALDTADEDVANKEWLNAGSYLTYSAAARAKSLRKLNFVQVASAKRPKSGDFDTMPPVVLPAGAPKKPAAAAAPKQEKKEE